MESNFASNLFSHDGYECLMLWLFMVEQNIGPFFSFRFHRKFVI